MMDSNPNILTWASEELAIPYISPIDQRRHRYFPDIVCKTRKKDGTIVTSILEIKPKAQCAAPERKKKKERTFINEVATYGVNQAKWASAREYCLNKGWEFRILTEDDIYGKKK